jgi:hypothetical protein
METRYVGHENQLLTARRVTYTEGTSKGVQAIELRNSVGLYTTCVEDQCLNLFDFSYKGINFAFQSKNGLASTLYFNGGAPEFSYYWPGGMMYTCGLLNVGPGGVMQDGIFHPDHGRIGMMPAQDVMITRDETGVTITGTVHEAMLAGYHLVLKRKIRFPATEKRIIIEDTVTNLEPQATEFMLLYHVNLGYPLLSAESRVVKGKGGGYSIHTKGPIPQDWAECREPEDHKEEDLFCHENTPDQKGYGYGALINDSLGMGCYVKYHMENLPWLMHWRNMCSHDYVVGLEPSNNQVLGRDQERKNGTLHTLLGYESKTFRVEIGVLDGAEEIAAFEAMVGSLGG